MVKFFNEYIGSRLTGFLKRIIVPINEINRKYSTPHLKTGKAVRFALICLRIYLATLVFLIFYKFYLTLTK